MKCENALELISASLDGELTAAEEAQLRDHLAQCPACRALQTELAGLQAAAQAGLETAAPPELKANIMKNLPNQAKSAGKVVYWKRWGAMAAAIALVALAAWQLPRFVFDPVGVAPAADNSIAGTTESAADLTQGPQVIFSYTSDRAADRADVDTDAIPDAGATYGAASAETGSSPAPAPATGAVAPSVNSTVTNTAAPKKQTQPADTAAPETQPEDLAAPAQTESAQPDSVDVTNGQEAPLVAVVTSGDAPASFSLPLPGDGPDEAIPEGGNEDQLLLQSAPTGGASVGGGDIGGTGGGLLQSAPAPESGAVDDPPVESRMAKLDTALAPIRWCGVLTLAEYEPAADYPLEILEDGRRQYTLPAADFQALVETLDAGGAAYELRTDGEDVSPDAQIGLVVVSVQP